MNDKQHTLTPEIQASICNFIRAGGFPEIAAEAVGIPAKVFHYWVRCSQAQRPVPLYRDFGLAVRQAQAQARLFAEHRAMQDDPLVWLKSGPGKETARMPGWTSPIKPLTPPKRTNGLSAERLQLLVGCLLTALTPFPEARLVAAQALDDSGLLSSDPPLEEDGGVAESVPAVEEPRAEEMPAMVVEETAPLPSVAEVVAAVTPVVELPGVSVGPQATEGGAAAKGEVRTMAEHTDVSGPQATRNETTSNPQRSDKEPAAKPQARSGKTAKTRVNAWDSLDAAHWTVFLSS